MSASYLFSQNADTIDPKFLPSGAVDPNLSQVLAEGNTSGANDMVLAQSLLMPSAGSPVIELNGVDGIIDCATLRVNGPGPTNVIELSGNGEIACGALDVGSLIAESGAGARVIVNANGSPGYGLVVGPANQTTGAGAINLLNGSSSINPTEYVVYNSSTSGSGLTAGHFVIQGLAVGNTRNILDASPSGDYYTVGDSSVAGGVNLEVNGASGLGRVYDTRYNPTLTITPVASGTASDIATITALTDIPAGTYQLQLTAETVTPANFTTIRMFAVAPPSSSVINFSCVGFASQASDGNVLGLNTGFFNFAGGALTVTVQSSGLNWTASEWSVQLVRFG
jgi:hypothetical protein